MWQYYIIDSVILLKSQEVILKAKEMLPTSVTMGNIICGFISILCVLHQKFEIAAWLIVVAMVLDAVDGRLARMMKSTSNIGGQLDSMADLVTFGIAPAVLLTKICFNTPPAMLWAIGLFFLICIAFRLARFNAQKDEGVSIPKHFYTGLPTTLAGGTIAQLIILDRFLQTKVGTDIVITFLPFIAIALGLFMISKIPFFNITGKIGIKQGIPAMILEFSAAIFFFIVAPELALSITLSFYLIICVMYGVIKGKTLRKSYSIIS